MKKLILILGILIGLSIGVSAEVSNDTTRKVSSKRDIKKNFETSFTKELVKYIETGDVTPLLDLVQEDDITFLGLLPGTYKNSENKEYFAQFIKKYLNVRSTGLTILQKQLKQHYFNYLPKN